MDYVVLKPGIWELSSCTSHPAHQQKICKNVTLNGLLTISTLTVIQAIVTPHLDSGDSLLTSLPAFSLMPSILFFTQQSSFSLLKILQ